MTISDNGRGAQKTALDGMGTSNMRLRTKALKGNIDWRNSNGEREGNSPGVTVALSFPIERAGGEAFDMSSPKGLTARKVE